MKSMIWRSPFFQRFPNEDVIEIMSVGAEPFLRDASGTHVKPRRHCEPLGMGCDQLLIHLPSVVELLEVGFLVPCGEPLLFEANAPIHPIPAMPWPYSIAVRHCCPFV